MDTKVLVLVANRPRLMRELVLSTLSEQAGIRVVSEAADEQDVPSLVADYAYRQHGEEAGSEREARAVPNPGGTIALAKAKSALPLSKDLYYLQNWTFLFDLRIIAMTILSGLIHRNAY